MDKIQVSGINIEWSTEKGICNFENLPVAMMWVDTTLAGLMAGVQSMVGSTRFNLALQSEGRKSVEDDWKVIAIFTDFKEGFKAIANIAAVAGWGSWELILLDKKKKECRFRIGSSWEGLYQKALGVCWGSGMLAGKMAGYCSKLFRVNCWAEQTGFIARGDEFDEFLVKPSERSIEKEIENLLSSDKATRADMAVALEKLRKEISERRQAEYLLSDSEEKYRILFESASDAILIAQDDYIKFPNQVTEKITGYSKEELLSFPLAHFISPQDRDVVLGRYEKRLAGNEVPSTYSFRILNKSGNEVWVQLNAVQIMWEGRPATLNFLRDITQQRILENQLRKAQKMEAVGTLAGGIAHDFNNLLSPIIGYAEMLRDDLGVNDERRKATDEIIRAGFRARDLVRQLLAFGRRQTLEVKPVDLNGIIDGFEKLLRRTIPEDIELEVIPSPEIQTIMADIGQIEQVLMNLAVNAADAMPGGGKLTIETAMVDLDEKYASLQQEVDPGRYVMLAVCDTGGGIDKEIQDQIFEPFFTSKGEKGTGLGLSTVYGIVKQHGGHISVYSEPGQGTTFKLYLPVADKARAEGRTDKKITTDLKGSETILLVEDDEQVRNVAQSILKLQGYKVLLAKSANEALAVLEKNDCSAHLLVTDVVMPDMNGKKMFELIARKCPELKVLYMSGYTDNVIAHRGVLDEGVNFIQKPFTVQALSTKVREILNDNS